MKEASMRRPWAHSGDLWRPASQAAPQVLARLIKGYNFRFQPRCHAVDLIETLHVVLGMLDRLASAGGRGCRCASAPTVGASAAACLVSFDALWRCLTG